MRHRRCHTCLCRSCLNTCCDRKTCTGKKDSCKRYKGFQQLSFFDEAEPPKSTPRYSWEYYGLDDKAYRKKLYTMCQSRKYDGIVRKVAHRTNEDIAEYIFKSVTQNKSYWKIEFDDKLGRICYGKSDFYGIRRRFYYLFDLELKKRGILAQNIQLNPLK